VTISLFIADLHLHDARPEITACFETFLQGPARQADQLFILGDLFESWVGDDQDGELPQRVAGKLRELSDTGVRCRFMAGNRDFLLGPDYCARAGMELIEEPYCLTLAGIDTVLLHGDILCSDDHDYQAFRRMVREPKWQRDFLARPLQERKRMAQAARAESQQHIRGATDAIMDVNVQAVADLFKSSGAQRIIHGHTHRPAIHNGGSDHERIVLGDWYTQGSALSITDRGAQLDTLST